MPLFQGLIITILTRKNDLYLKINLHIGYMEIIDSEFIDAKVTAIETTGIGGNFRTCGVSGSLRNKLSLTNGDLILISSSARSVVLNPLDFNGRRDIVALDSQTRRNLNVEIAEIIKVKKIQNDDIDVARRVEVRVHSFVQKDANGVEISNVNENIDDLVKEKEREITSMVNNLVFMNGTLMELPLGNDLGVQCSIHGSNSPFIITEETQIIVRITRWQVGDDITFEDIGGLDDEVERVREAVELPINYPELFEYMKLNPPRGILLKGAPGTGKTLIAKAEATMAGLYPVTIDGASIMSKFYGESEERLRHKFREAIDNAPSLVIIDELDALAPKRSEHGGRAEMRVVAQLLTLMDGIHKSQDDVIVLGTTNRVNAVDPALRRPGRFEIEIEIGVPNEDGRQEILDIHLRETPMSDDIDIKEIARETHGYVGADLAGLVSRAKYKAIREVVPDIDEKVEITPELLQALNLKQIHLERGLTEMQPSAMREVLAEVPKVKWEDVGGLSEEVSKIKEVIVLPLTKGDKFEDLGVKPPSGILLYGPPGCGKTLIAKAVATESKANFISIKGPELRSKWVGESEKGIRMIFAKARQVAPCVIYFDECESIGRTRGTITADSGVGENILSQLLTEMDGLEGRENIVVIMATNRPDILDPALMRRGRLDRHIYIGHPSTDEEKREIFNIHAEPMKIADDVNVDKLIETMENFSGSDIHSTCQEAGMLAIKNDDEVIRMKHFEEILKDLKGSIAPQMIEYYTKIREILTSKKMRIEDSEWSKKYV